LKIGVIVAAAGSGRRMGAQDNKVLLPLAGKPVLAHSLACFGSLEEVSEVVVVTKEEDRPRIETLMQEILKDNSEINNKVRASFVVDTLTYLHRGGRCSTVAKLLANTLKLKPEI